LHQSIGNLDELTLDEAWNSPEAQAIRASILDGSYEFCSSVHCPKLGAGTSGLIPNAEVTDSYHRRIIQKGQTKLPFGPREVTLGYDTSCALSCPACRKTVHTCDGEAATKIATIQEHVFGSSLQNTAFITMSSNGEPFDSGFYLDALRSFNWSKYVSLRINLITNGLKLDEAMWASIRKCHGSINSVFVSVNAATRATYEKVQRGGSWETLQNNLAFIARLYAEKCIPKFVLTFYVQDNNFREMKDFVALGRQLGVEMVLFGPLLQSGSHSRKAYREAAVHMPGHPRHAEFRALLEDPIFQDPIVQLGMLAEAPEPVEEAESLMDEQELDWQSLLEFLGIGEHTATAHEMLDILNAAKDRLAAHLRKPAENQNESPLGLLARMRNGNVAKARDRFRRFAATQRPVNETQTYMQTFAEHEAALRRKLYWLLTEAGRDRFLRLKIASFLEIETGYDPVPEAIRRMEVSDTGAQGKTPKKRGLRYLLSRLGLRKTQSAGRMTG